MRQKRTYNGMGVSHSLRVNKMNILLHQLRDILLWGASMNAAELRRAYDNRKRPELSREVVMKIRSLCDHVVHQQNIRNRD